jgi:hypothetical protein
LAEHFADVVVVLKVGWVAKVFVSVVDIAALTGLAVLAVERRVMVNDGRLFVCVDCID